MHPPNATSPPLKSLVASSRSTPLPSQKTPMNALTLPHRAAILTALIPLLLLSCTSPSNSDQDADPNNAAFVTLLGNDTLAVEQFVRTPTRMEADVVLRTPNTTVRQYVLDMDETGALQRFEATVRAPSEPADAPPVRHEVGTLVGDSLIVVATEGDETQTRAIAAHGGMLPFLDMIHWPFELMLTRAYASGADSVTQDLFTGRGSIPFVVRRIDDNAMTAQHPFRGTMDVRVDDSGRLLHLDAGATTRKLIVERVPSVDIEALAASFAARDQEGRSFGALSGRGEVNTTVHGAAIQADYGTPSKRGRELFGALVPYGEVWRTGANRATHFTTDRNLVVRDLEVPAGEYTLYTIPSEEGGLLLINTQTGQGGTTYDANLDRGRVDLTRTTLDESVEVFTIRVEEMEEGGALKLQWGTTELSVPFGVE